MMALALGVVAFFYAMVGHGGASGYLAVGALLGQPMQALKAQALVLNLGVAGLALLFFTRAKWMRFDLLGWLALGSIPAAYASSQWGLSSAWSSALLSLALCSSALRLLLNSRLKAYNEAALQAKPSAPVLVCVGLGLGLLAGMTGVGGGIYLSPLLLILRWADIKETAAVSAGFIVLNSGAGLAGLLSKGPLPVLPTQWIGAALLGGLLGAYLGAGWVPKRRLAQVLAGALLLAAFKLGAKALG